MKKQGKEKSYYFTVILFLFTNWCSCQITENNANIWYFGDFAGLDFNAGAPVALNNSAMSTVEGCATVCDTYGSLLFYTDGELVYDRTHNIMPNGDSLLGDWSATQSSIIVPSPYSDSLYYVFTVGENGENGLRYSMVNMNLNNGLGDVMLSTKNIQLLDENSLAMNVTEKITAITHIDNKSVWIVAHQAVTNKFYTYLIDYYSASISTATAWSVGSNHVTYWGSTHGYMKASVDGSKIALAIHSLIDDGIFEVVDFNKSTGQISNPRSAKNIYRPYGVEFSAEGTKLYGTSSSFSTTPSKIYQFDLEAPDFSASMAQITSTTSLNLLALQLGVNGKIYVAQNFTNYLGVINYPDSSANSCDYNFNGVYLNTGVCRYGLPTLFYYKGFQFVGKEETLSNPNTVEIYPNPCSTEITFITKNLMSIEIANSIGQATESIQCNSNTVIIDISGYPAGIYFAKLISKDGIAIKKVIKE